MNFYRMICWWMSAILIVSTAGGAGASLVPFVLPWDDSSEGPANLASLNPPIDENARVAVDGQGHFVARGERIRFWGVNFAGDSPFMPTNHADAVAGRLSKFGINNVRFHHMDPSWAAGGGLIDYSRGNSRTLRSSQLERLHFLLSRLRAHGVYADINLLVGREFRAADGLPSAVERLDWKDRHILGFFNDTALALQKEYATELLTSTNRFTGLTVSKDPVVAFVEILNENGIIQKWCDGALDALPEVFSAELGSLWNRWLADRYHETTAMKRAWGALSFPLGGNLITNSAFLRGSPGWRLETHEGARAELAVVRDPGLGAVGEVHTLRPGSAGWHVQFNYGGLQVREGEVYTLRFQAKASRAERIEVSVMQDHADWKRVGHAQDVRVTEGWKEFIACFRATATDSEVRLNFGGLGSGTNTLSLARVELRTGGELGGLPAEAGSSPLESGRVPLVRRSGDGLVGTAQTRRDWVEFLLGLEQRYYDRMREHIRRDCGYTGLLFGSILANSPANVQAQMDVVDAHGYWQHPEFPGHSWDSRNWTVKNVSMVNSTRNTLTDIARQRVKGKPFVVTEYQHPSPNSYASEGPLLAAAYASLQDWDGLWFFDYGPGESSAPMGFFRGFFEVGQHPGKMANLMLGGLMFRRGDVSPTRNETSLALSPSRELGVLAERSAAWSIASGSLLGASPEATLIHRFSLGVGADAKGEQTPPAAPAGPLFVSDTGQLKWDVSLAGKGLVTVNTPRCKSVVGFPAGRSLDLDGVVFRPGESSTGWSSLGWIRLGSGTLSEAGRSLLVVCGSVENTDMQWTDASRTSVGTRWGRAPTLVERVPFTLTWPVAAGRVKVWALDERGQRQRALAVSPAGEGAVLTVDESSGALWFEVEVAGR